MKQIIEQLLSGFISMDVFLGELQNNQKLQQSIRDFVPEEAKEDSTHSFWKIVPYSSLRQNNFDYYQFLFWGLHDREKHGMHLNIFSRLRRAYQYYYPDVQCTSRYDDAFDIYLDATRDCFDGPEVSAIVDQIITDAMQLPSKAKRTKHAQMMVKMNFHVEKKRPRWIQGPEWPMGSSSPMAFVSQKKTGEAVNYEFRDVDTDDVRIVKQYY